MLTVVLTLVVAGMIAVGFILLQADRSRNPDELSFGPERSDPRGTDPGDEPW